MRQPDELCTDWPFDRTDEHYYDGVGTSSRVVTWNLINFRSPQASDKFWQWLYLRKRYVMVSHRAGQARNLNKSEIAKSDVFNFSSDFC